MGKFRGISSHQIISFDYILLKSSKSYDEYQWDQGDYYIVNTMLHAGHATFPRHVENEVIYFFHDPCIVSIDGIDYIIDRPCKVVVKKDIGHFVKNDNWFRSVKFTKLIKK